jgi:hypothetical protein
MFDCFHLQHLTFAGPHKRRPPRVAVWLQHRILGRYFSPDVFVCPNCGTADPLVELFRVPRLLRVTVYSVNRLITRIQSKRSYWIIGFFTRTEG